MQGNGGTDNGDVDTSSPKKFKVALSDEIFSNGFEGSVCCLIFGQDLIDFIATHAELTSLYVDEFGLHYHGYSLEFEQPLIGHLSDYIIKLWIKEVMSMIYGISFY